MSARIFMVGSGAVAQCTLPILVKELPIDPRNITIMDFVDNRHRVAEILERGATYVQQRITPENYQEILGTYLTSGDIFIDLSWSIDTVSLLQWCYDHNVRYVNSSIELWETAENLQNKTPEERTLYTRQMAIAELIKSFKNKKGATAILDHGANPGLVSHFTKQAITDIAEKIIKEKPADTRVPALQQQLHDQNFAQLAQLIGLTTVQIAERDSQITNEPKKVNEFVNTWSIQGLAEEGIAPSELGWGTHEKYAPQGVGVHKTGPKNQIFLSTKGIDTLVKSWVPSGDIIGMVIRHGEAYGISERLTVWQDEKPIYRPTVYYAYCLSDSAIMSLYELRMRQFELQPKLRILEDEIIGGVDELGCFLLGHDYKAWWIGSLLDITEARRLVPHQNATTVQVAIAVVAAVNYMLKFPNEGICLPDDLDYREILSFAKPYLGSFISKQVDWSPLTCKSAYFNYNETEIDIHDEWQFTNFLISPFTKVKLR
jgi:homospermidine synthase